MNFTIWQSGLEKWTSELGKIVEQIVHTPIYKIALHKFVGLHVVESNDIPNEAAIQFDACIQYKKSPSLGPIANDVKKCKIVSNQSFDVIFILVQDWNFSCFFD